MPSGGRSVGPGDPDAIVHERPNPRRGSVLAGVPEPVQQPKVQVLDAEPPRLRDELVQSYRDHFPAFVSCRLLRPEEGGTWVDLWYWTSKEGAEHALAMTVSRDDRNERERCAHQDPAMSGA